VSFGRDADIALDSNPFLHRRTGAFAHENGRWTVQNLGAKLYLTIIADDGTRVELPPGSMHVLPVGGGVVRVIAGRSTYELRYEVTSEIDADAPTVVPPSETTKTVQFDPTLTPREIDFLVTFARPSLLGLNEPMPTYAEAARLWGISPKTLDNTLQSIRRKFRTLGLVRDLALDGLIQSAIRHSLITRADVEWAQLDSPQPRPASSGRRFNDPDGGVTAG
jgi:hypothetical protein